MLARLAEGFLDIFAAGFFTVFFLQCFVKTESCDALGLEADLLSRNAIDQSMDDNQCRMQLGSTIWSAERTIAIPD